MHLPGHTPDHVGFVIGKAVFTGDSIFNVSCLQICKVPTNDFEIVQPDVGSARADFPGGNAELLYAVRVPVSGFQFPTLIPARCSPCNAFSPSPKTTASMSVTTIRRIVIKCASRQSQTNAPGTCTLRLVSTRPRSSNSGSKGTLCSVRLDYCTRRCKSTYVQGDSPAQTRRAESSCVFQSGRTSNLIREKARHPDHTCCSLLSINTNS